MPQRSGGAAPVVTVWPIAQTDSSVTLEVDAAAHAGLAYSLTIDGQVFSGTLDGAGRASVDVGNLAAGLYTVDLTIAAANWSFSQHVQIIPAAWHWHDGTGGTVPQVWQPK